MNFNIIKKRTGLSNDMEEFYLYQLSIYHKYIGKISLVLGLFNSLLLIPDLILVNSASKKVGIILFRAVFSILLFWLFFYIDKIKKMTVLFRIVSTFELLAILEFLLVLNFYTQPNFMIQAMGMIIIDIAVFLIPNRWSNMLAISILGTSGFLMIVFFMKYSKREEFLAGTVYLSLVIVLCSVFAFAIHKYQFGEFISKKELIHLSSTDPLTQAWNRKRLFDEFNTVKTGLIVHLSIVSIFKICHTPYSRVGKRIY